MKQSPLLEFQSAAFHVEPGEDEATNPGIFGKALAQWLAGELRMRGFSTGEVIAEDFGWCVPVRSRPHGLYLACSSVDADSRCWAVFSFAEGGFMGRLFGKDTRAQDVASVFAATKAALMARPDVHDICEDNR